MNEIALIFIVVMYFYFVHLNYLFIEQIDDLRKLMFKRCSSRCAEKVKQVENYLKDKSRTAKKRMCRSVPSVPRALKMLTSDG